MRPLVVTCICLVAAICLSVSATAQGPTTTSDDPLALMNARVVDVRSGRITASATIVLRNGKIESIGSNPRPAEIRGVDLKGNYVLPGLIDAHVHAASLEAFRRALESGVTTARSAGVSYYVDVGFRELVKAGAVAGPDVIAAGYHVRPQLANEAFLSDPQYWDLMDGVTTVERIRRAVRMNLSHGVDWIKVHATERAGTADTDPRKQVYTEDELRAIVQEAASKDVPVQAHAHGDEGAAAAIRAGVRSVEHGTYLSDATLQLMKERGVYLVATYGIVTDMGDAGGAFDSAALRIRAQHMLPRLRDMLQRAHRIGVRIVAGTDSDYGPSSLVRIGQEMTYLVEFGFSPLESIQAATIRSAEMLRLEKSIGLVEVGYQADLIAVERNPLEDITTVQDPVLVISNGRVVLDRLNPESRRRTTR